MALACAVGYRRAIGHVAEFVGRSPDINTPSSHFPTHAGKGGETGDSILLITRYIVILDCKARRLPLNRAQLPQNARLPVREQ